MSPDKIPNRIFIKLLLGFWLCSSIIIAAVGLLPLLQQKHDRAPLPQHLENLLSRQANRISEEPKLLEQQNLRRLNHRRNFKGKPVRLYLVDDQGRVMNTDKVSRGLRRFMLMADEVDQPISHQFKNELLFGPYNFDVLGRQYSLFGRLADHHPRPWFFFFAENKLLTLGLAITLSGLLCGLLAWHLGRPLRTLKLSANALANGDLTCRVDDETTNRKDEIGQLAQAFNSMADSVENMVNSQQRLISDISHELRTPLTRLQLALALSRKKGHESAEISRIGYEAELLEKMIAELLELSKVKLNANESKRHLGLAETLGQVLDDAEFEAEQQQKKLLIDISEEIELPLYPRPLSRAIENLLRNAIRYSNSSVSIQTIEAQSKVMIEIIDDGPGIEDEKDLKAIFKPFYRPQSARERESGGWGLGLAIAEAAILAHQGQISAENIQPHGLKITINLPTI
ncbi:two-component sensor histidine kinase [Shewanella hanedai]|jgi:two-component system sensor histidine kinase CpxA|uniref:histidine kinase n=1 Tax=Shewanella hanedai TaxID=25 RepID=A0A553JIY5_SHEHA|nr:ATP-binding protein [Shewanella hanedai]TRY12368.1 HAMP domain-containing protein [Shewanella hanedai]GGI97610.1 two-component sensor histidine kinase [Shewanella hanedai]